MASNHCQQIDPVDSPEDLWQQVSERFSTSRILNAAVPQRGQFGIFTIAPLATVGRLDRRSQLADETLRPLVL